MSPISLALLSLLAIHSSQAVLFATKVVQNADEPLPQNVQMPNHIRLRRSGAVTHPECHRSVITERCALTGDFDACVRATCSECIAESTFNPFDMYCMRLTACVCTIIKDGSCYAVTAADCY
ncbi:hypothetical protein PRIPAC_91642 [Pristionchus pacificus]|uniref:Uncharacterized protein n=1 Tax=Pristionchus pacificus TaxID=54126 RepID=A0A454Y6P8_PRIPA|nr:hypothetical protein PRIPAC_91642 [Pristionchus pacificus]|eukprot:PDM76066.1 hypothetical protein PRIPAC_39670 [Pristionchus pacificus]